MNTILINATAARCSGALTILNQFITHIKQNDGNSYYIFVDTNYEPVSHFTNIKYIHIDTTAWGKRIFWDNWGFKRYVQANALNPSLIISFQNTGVRYNENIPQLIYYHQALPLFEKQWNFFKSQERLFFLYKYLYSYFVSQSIHKNVFFVVQIQSIKEAFLQRYNISSERVHVLPPEIQTIDYGKVSRVDFEDGKKHFIYPASPHLYKNHSLLLKALHLIKKRNVTLFQMIRLHLTLSEDDVLDLSKQVHNLGVEDAIVYEGVLPFQKLLACYKSMDALLFPSYIETFGLPLLEAAGAGMCIIASDLPYVHDVIGGYEGVSYQNYEDVEAWASAIESLCLREKKSYAPFQYLLNKGTWNDFFTLMNELKIKD